MPPIKNRVNKTMAKSKNVVNEEVEMNGKVEETTPMANPSVILPKEWSEHANEADRYVAVINGHKCEVHLDQRQGLWIGFAGEKPTLAHKDMEKVMAKTKAVAEATEVMVETPVETKKKGDYKKTVCPISKARFKAKASSIKLVIDGKSYDVEPRAFSTGSLGWNANGKTEVVVDGVKCSCQIGFNLTVIGSKEAAE